jgi:hypothetical protein
MECKETKFIAAELPEEDLKILKDVKKYGDWYAAYSVREESQKRMNEAEVAKAAADYERGNYERKVEEVCKLKNVLERNNMTLLILTIANCLAMLADLLGGIF